MEFGHVAAGVKIELTAPSAIHFGAPVEAKAPTQASGRQGVPCPLAEREHIPARPPSLLFRRNSVWGKLEAVDSRKFPDLNAPLHSPDVSKWTEQAIMVR